MVAQEMDALPVSAAALWRSVLPTPAEVARGRRRLHAKAMGIVALVASSYAVLVFSNAAVWVRFVAGLPLVAGLIAVGTGIMHDANHGAFSGRSWVNRCLSATSDLLGSSSSLWRIQHNRLHHGHPNVLGQDADIELSPFGRLHPGQQWRRWYRWQHVYLWPLYGFMALKNLLVSDVMTVCTRRIGAHSIRERVGVGLVTRITLGKLAHLSWALVLPMLFNPWWKVLLFYLGCSWIVGFVLAVTFQLAHCVELTAAPAGEVPGNFVASQLATTADIRSRGFTTAPLRWLVGGLDHQVVHHLAPRLPHTLYRTLSARFEAVSAKAGVVYHQHASIGAAVRSHARWLKAMSLRPAPLTTG
jgi:linoleoyl-CoA desaturase